MEEKKLKKGVSKRNWREIISVLLVAVMVFTMMPAVKANAASDKEANAKAGLVNYRTHVQTYGWQDFKCDGQMSGTSGEAKRLECIEIKLGDTGYQGGVMYRTHVQSYGWQEWAYDGLMSGTFGMGKRLEGIEISLYGEVSEHYDIYYRVHVQSYGWQDWVSNGLMAGTSGEAKRLEGIEIKLVKKDDVKPEGPLKLELSGKASDTYTITEDCYVEGEDVVIYLPKGITVKGDMLKITEKIMADLCETTGLNFEKNYDIKYPMECRDLHFEEGLFAEVNKDAQKINVIIINTNDGTAWASDHNAIVDITDYDYEAGLYQTIYHELSHVLQARNGIFLGSSMDEGYATYTSYVCQMEHGIPGWSAAQYFYPVEDVAKPLIEGGEDAFSIMYDVKDTNYQYGFRFLLFLSETYGEDTYYKIMEAAEKTEFTSGWNEESKKEDLAKNSDILIEVIKSQTSDDVFEDFADWYANDWDKVVEKKMAEIEAMSN